MCCTGDESWQTSPTHHCLVATIPCKFGCTTLLPVSSAHPCNFAANMMATALHTAANVRLLLQADAYWAHCTTWPPSLLPAPCQLTATPPLAHNGCDGCLQGWMHHLARHAVACFLTRGDLYVSWERGRDTFDRLLVDDDYFINNGETAVGCLPFCDGKH